MNTITRRTALAVPVTLPLLPVASDAQPGNATDYHWQRYHAAKVAFEATDRDYTAMEDSLPEHLKLKAMPKWAEYSPGEWRKRVDAWNRSRAELGAEAAGEACDQAAGRMNAAEAVVLETPGTTLTNIERKLSILQGFGDHSEIPIRHIDRLLVDVRALNGETIELPSELWPAATEPM